jgi:hypothetical protein
MRLHGVSLLLTDLATGRLLGQTLVCTETRYAVVLWIGADQLDRRYGSRAMWKSVRQEIDSGLAPGPIARVSPLAQLVIGDRADVVLQYLMMLPIEVPNSGDAVGVLDTYLRQNH